MRVITHIKRIQYNANKATKHLRELEEQHITNNPEMFMKIQEALSAADNLYQTTHKILQKYENAI